MNLRIRTFSMALIAMSAASQVYALPSDDSENKEKIQLWENTCKASIQREHSYIL